MKTLILLFLFSLGAIAQATNDGTGFDTVAFWQAGDNPVFTNLVNQPDFGPALVVYAQPWDRTQKQTFYIYAFVVIPGIPAGRPGGAGCAMAGGGCALPFTLLFDPSQPSWTGQAIYFPPGTKFDHLLVQMGAKGKVIPVAQ